MAMTINHAILHVFDFEGNASSFSQRELDLSERIVKSYVQRNLRKISASPESKHGEFLPQSSFAGELEHYLGGGATFVDFSTQIAEFLYQELRRAETAEPYDLLVADFVNDSDAAGTGAAPAASDDAEGGIDAPDPAVLEAAFAGQGERSFAIILLPRKQSFVHDVRHADGAAVNGIVRHDAMLPNPTQRLDSYALIETRTLAVDFNDKKRAIAGNEVALIPDGLLQCSTGASCKEVLQSVTSIVEEVAQEYGGNTAKAVSKAKAILNEKADESEYLPPWDLGREVFEDEPQMRERFEETARQRELPESVPVKKSVANRMAKTHRIRTDTGIEIVFPSEYSTSTDFIEFVNESDGSLSIELKRIGSIENR